MPFVALMRPLDVLDSTPVHLFMSSSYFMYDSIHALLVTMPRVQPPHHRHCKLEISQAFKEYPLGLESWIGHMSPPLPSPPPSLHVQVPYWTQYTCRLYFPLPSLLGVIHMQALLDAGFEAVFVFMFVLSF